MKQKYERLSQEIKDKLKQFTLEGLSLNSISKLTGLGKTTIYYQVKNFKTRQWRKMQIDISEFEMGELIGAFAGDGNFFHRKYDPAGNKDCSFRIRYFLSLKKDQNYAQYLFNLLKRLNLNPGIYIRREENTLCVNVRSKEFSETIKKYLTWEEDKTFTIRLKNELENYSEEFLRGFARGLMDTDGFTNSNSNVACACISKSLMDNLAQILAKFQIKISRSSIKREGNRRELFYVRVLKEGIQKYKNFIGFSSDYKQEQLLK